MPLNEKTLELNVTHELLTMHAWPSSLHHRFGLYAYHLLPRFWSDPSPYAIGLSLADENVKGYDVEIALPTIPARSVFLQFKLGHLTGFTQRNRKDLTSHRNTSRFLGSTRNPKPHYLFKGINKNSNMNQHGLMRNWSLGGPAGGQRVPVLYALPMVRDTDDLKTKASSGRLLTCTEFRSVAEVDSVYANLHGGRIGNEAHEIAIDVANASNWEIRSDNPVSADGSRTTAQFVGEVLAWQWYKWLYMVQQEVGLPEGLVEDWLEDSFLGAAYYLGVNRSEFLEFASNRLTLINAERSELFQLNQQAERVIEWELRNLFLQKNSPSEKRQTRGQEELERNLEAAYAEEFRARYRQEFEVARVKFRIDTLHHMHRSLMPIIEATKQAFTSNRSLPEPVTELMAAPGENKEILLHWDAGNTAQSQRKFRQALRQTSYQII
jgi:hypothetical protein